MNLGSAWQAFLGGQKSIRVGGFTITRKKDNTVVARRSTNSNKGKGKKRSMKQEAQNGSFVCMRAFTRSFGASVGQAHPSWKLFAEWMRRVSLKWDNCFHAMNHKCMNGNEVAYPSLFHFSFGELSMAWNMGAEREGNVVVFTWEDHRECPHAQGTDVLLVGLLYDKYRDRPTVVDTRVTRSKGAASITLNPAYGENVHLYPYFERADKRAYSEDRYFNFGF